MTPGEHDVAVFPASWTAKSPRRAASWVAKCATCRASSGPLTFKANADDWRMAHLAGRV